MVDIKENLVSLHQKIKYWWYRKLSWFKVNTHISKIKTIENTLERLSAMQHLLDFRLFDAKYLLSNNAALVVIYSRFGYMSDIVICAAEARESIKYNEVISFSERIEHDLTLADYMSRNRGSYVDVVWNLHEFLKAIKILSTLESRLKEDDSVRAKANLAILKPLIEECELVMNTLLYYQIGE